MKQLVVDDNGDQYTAWVTHFFFNFGIMIRDPRSVQRICNLIAAATGTGAFDEDLLIAAVNEFAEDASMAFFYMNRNMRKNMLITAKDKTNVNYTPDNPFGRRFLTSFMEVPVQIVDQLVQTEAEVAS